MCFIDVKEEHGEKRNVRHRTVHREQRNSSPPSRRVTYFDRMLPQQQQQPPPVYYIQPPPAPPMQQRFEETIKVKEQNYQPRHQNSVRSRRREELVEVEETPYAASYSSSSSSRSSRSRSGSNPYAHMHGHSNGHGHNQSHNHGRSRSHSHSNSKHQPSRAEKHRKGSGASSGAASGEFIKEKEYIRERVVPGFQGYEPERVTERWHRRVSGEERREAEVQRGHEVPRGYVYDDHLGRGGVEVYPQARKEGRRRW